MLSWKENNSTLFRYNLYRLWLKKKKDRRTSGTSQKLIKVATDVLKAYTRSRAIPRATFYVLLSYNLRRRQEEYKESF